jgi:hypothetical protein
MKARGQQVHENPKLAEFRAFEAKYLAAVQRTIDHELSITDLTQEERSHIKEYLKIQKESFVKSKYPEIKLSKVEK